MNRFFQSDYPLLDNFTHSDSFLVDRPDDEGWECLVGQAYPRGWQLFSTCVYFPIRLDFPPETLTLVNLLAGTCNTDKCNNDCNDVPDWFKSRKVNVGFFMILAAFGVVLVGGLIALVARLTDKTPKVPVPRADGVAVVVSSTRAGGTADDAKAEAKPPQASFSCSALTLTLT